MSRRGLALSLLATAMTLPAIAGAASPEAPPRIGIVVGARGGAPGRGGLRYAHRDAETIGDVLTSVGRFPRERVHVLRDPTPADLLALLQREAAALAGRPDALLFFYFSGHADQGALYSAGRPVPLEAVRKALDRQEVAVRVGVIDACQGGGWTRAKGLVPDAPFEVTLPQVLESEGSALISSSTGEESAHESDVLGGSFFTVHLAAGLRGAADESGDGEVTLTEAFEYARQQTIRDTARRAREPQHPSFALNLRGRQDLVLAQVAASPSTLAVAQERGPLELVHLTSGLRMLELPPGPRNARIAVPPGRYLLRRVASDGIHAQEIDVPRRGQVLVSEADLTLVPSERLVVKGPGAASSPSTPAAGDWELSLGMITSFLADRLDVPQIGPVPYSASSSFIRFDGRVGLTDRLVWRAGTLGFAYRFTAPFGTEVVPYGGLLAWSNGQWGPAIVGGGAAIRHAFGPQAVIATAGVDYEQWISGKRLVGWAFVRAHGSLGYGLELGKFGAMHLGVLYRKDLANPDLYGGFVERDLLVIGSAQDLGLASLPFVRLRLAAAWALDLNVAAIFLKDDHFTRRDVTFGASLLRRL